MSWSSRPTCTSPLAQVADHVADRGPVAVVAHRGDDTRRLVHRVGDAVVADLDPDAVDGDLVRPRVDPHALHGDLRPFTLIRPASIMSSQTRREPTPARARTFCRRSPCGRRRSPSARGRPGGRGRAPCPRTSRRRPRWGCRRRGQVVRCSVHHRPVSHPRRRPIGEIGDPGQSSDPQAADVAPNGRPETRPIPPGQASGCSSSIVAVSGRNGARSGRSARLVSPSRSRNSGVVA